MSRFSRPRRAGRAQRAGSIAVSLVHLLGAVLLALGVLLFLASRSGRLKTVAHVADDHIGVLVDHRAGELRPIEQAGYRFVLPGLQAVHTLERSPVEFRMQGGQRVGDDDVPFLVVRARDGSRLWFDSVVIQYQIDAAHAARALTDTGPQEGSRGALVDAYARPVLAEEFGRFTAGEIVQPENRRAAVERAQERLIALLAPHGIALREVAVSRPRFEDRYEKTIERRKVAEQEIGRLVLEAEQLVEGQAAEERRFERKLELQLAKDSDQWARELQDLRHAEQLLAAGRGLELERLERARAATLEAARATWAQRRSAAEAELGALERSRAPRLEAVRAEHQRRLAALATEQGRRRDERVRSTETLLAEKPGQLERQLREAEFARREAQARQAAELLTAQAEVRRLLDEAESQAAARDQAADLEHALRRARAQNLLARHAGEARAFGDLARALETSGEAGVRSALVEVLGGVELQLESPAREHDGAAQARPAARR